ncbi:MAG: M23 family metallopeptidase [Bacteroidia bacterium]
MEENLQQIAQTYAQGLWIASGIFAALALFRLVLVIKTKSQRTWIFKAKADFFVIGLKVFFCRGLIAFLADIPVWFLSVAQFRSVAPALPLSVLIFVLAWLSVQEIILCFTVSHTLIHQFIKRILFFLVSIFCGSSFILAAFIVPGTFLYPPQDSTIELQMPAKGTWLAANAGHQKWVNYHNNFPPQAFAIDMVKLNEAGRFFENEGVDSSDFYSFGDSVFAPASGYVYQLADGFPTQQIYKGVDSINPAGNFIQIHFGLNQYLFLAHLQAGSLQVAKGDSVQAGQFLALAGNSGNTSFPHVHIHIQDKPVLNDSLAKGLPFVFKGIERKRYLGWEKPSYPFLLRNDKFRN